MLVCSCHQGPYLIGYHDNWPGLHGNRPQWCDDQEAGGGIMKSRYIEEYENTLFFGGCSGNYWWFTEKKALSWWFRPVCGSMSRGFWCGFAKMSQSQPYHHWPDSIKLWVKTLAAFLFHGVRCTLPNSNRKFSAVSPPCFNNTNWAVSAPSRGRGSKKLMCSRTSLWVIRWLTPTQSDDVSISYL
jgi:hypothetical protein